MQYGLTAGFGSCESVPSSQWFGDRPASQFR